VSGLPGMPVIPPRFSYLRSYPGSSTGFYSNEIIRNLLAACTDLDVGFLILVFLSFQSYIFCDITSWNCGHTVFYRIAAFCPGCNIPMPHPVCPIFLCKCARDVLSA